MSSAGDPGRSRAREDEAHLDEVAAQKLPHEGEHLAALERMAGLEPYYRWVA